MPITTGCKVSPPLFSLIMKRRDMCVTMNNESCFLVSCGEHSLVFNSHFPELSDPCGEVTEVLLVWETDREVAQIGSLQWWNKNRKTCWKKIQINRKKMSFQHLVCHDLLLPERTMNCKVTLLYIVFSICAIMYLVVPFIHRCIATQITIGTECIKTCRQSHGHTGVFF